MPENPKSPRDRFLDDLLDASLREYGRTEPRIGLENRVLRRIEEAPQKSLWLTGWHWSAVGVVVTMIVVAMALISYPPEARVGPGATPSTTTPPPDRTIRMNKTIPQSGTRPHDIFVPKPLGLPPCKAGEVPAGEVPSMKKNDETTSKAKSKQDCVPVSTRQQPQRRDPQK